MPCREAEAGARSAPPLDRVDRIRSPPRAPRARLPLPRRRSLDHLQALTWVTPITRAPVAHIDRKFFALGEIRCSARTPRTTSMHSKWPATRANPPEREPQP